MSPKIKIVGFGGGLDTSQNAEIIEMRVFWFSHEQIGKLSDQIEAEKIPGAFKLIIFIDLPIHHENEPKMTDECKVGFENLGH